MTQPSLDAPPLFAPQFTPSDGPMLECARSRTDEIKQALVIRAHRAFAAAPEQVFATWTRASAWESWLRLRARSRATIAPYCGGAFRLELAEGATIHVITGTVVTCSAPHRLSFSWVHHNANDARSTLDVSVRQLDDCSTLSLVHRAIGSRREAAWLMRLWTSALDRLASHVAHVTHGRPLARAH